MNAVTLETSSILVRRAQLSPSQMNQMYGLLDRHFDGVTREQFDRDLAEKNWVILLAREERLVGFSTLLAYESSFRRAPVSVIYSGDTIVAREAWGTPALPRAWIAAVNQVRATVPRGQYFWLLLTSGFRTYRFLPVFWREFYPRFDRSTPTRQQELLEHLARERFGPQYDPGSGIVRFSQPQRLRSDASGIPENRSADLHVSFFASRNPGWAQGDELVCLTELIPENLTAAGRRMAAPTTFASPVDHS
jgi:hypothetical protein